jgi:arginyl-tRNA synthetase
MQDQLISILKIALEKAAEEGKLNREEGLSIVLNIPPQKDQGDYATPLAFSLAKTQKQSPRNIASLLVAILNQSPPLFIEKIEVAGAGYINFFVKQEAWRKTLLEVLNQREAYGQSDLGLGKKVLIEFVSANPTGPLHVAHGRAAALGDALTRLLQAVGFTVEQEYYLNDIGTQMMLLGRSTALRYRELLGETIELPEGAYQGDYIIDMAKSLKEKEGETLRDRDDAFFGQYSFTSLCSVIEADLRMFGIHFDRWFSEGALHKNKEVEQAISLLRSKGMVYEADGAVWVATTRYGDDKDRVILRQSGEMTYFASDIAYHKNKFDRGYDRMINIWGADHHGYVARVKAAVEAMGYSPKNLDIVIHQLVNLLRDGKPVRMSKRSGEFVTLREVVEEVGVDATRFFFLMRRSDTSLDFDLALAKSTSDENPVYYVQYAHARICSILRVAQEQGLDVENTVLCLTDADLAPLTLPEEMDLLCKLALYPDAVGEAASRLEPHRINVYLMELAALLHRYYFKARVITEDRATTRARLGLVMAVQIVLKSALGLLGVTAPEKM